MREILKDEIWFCGKDVAEALGYVIPIKAIRDHVEDCDKLGVQIGTLGQHPETTFINEAGLYPLII